MPTYWIRWLVIVWSLFFLTARPWAAPVELERASDGVYLSTQLPLKLPQSLQAALDQGITLNFVVEVAIYRKRWYWYDKAVGQVTRYMRLSFQPLTQRYRLSVSSQEQGGVALSQYFARLEEALAVMGHIQRWRIVDNPAELEGTNYGQFRFELDTSQLPRLLQVGGIGQDEAALKFEQEIKL